MEVGENLVGAIGPGLLVLECAQGGDTDAQVERLVGRLLNFRVLSDENGRMNLTLRDVVGALLVVPQFTLAADTGKGNRGEFPLVRMRQLKIR